MTSQPAHGSRSILAIDQGTTNSKAVVIDQEGVIRARASRPVSITYPQPAWVEQDPLEIWQSVRDAIDECLAIAGNVTPDAVAVTNQRESVMVWERRSGRPLGPVAIWQCQRGAAFCAELRASGLEPWLRERTGLTVDSMFSASKVRWLLQHVPDGPSRAANGEICVGTMDSWVLWNLTGGGVHACDLTNASRTQLLDLRVLSWGPDLLNLFEVPAAALPQALPSGNVYGTTVPCGDLPGGVPIAALIGDSHGALYGHAGFRPGSVKATYGTGSSLMTPTPQPLISERGLSTTLAWVRESPIYALEGNIYVTGAAVQWLGQFLSLEDPVQGVEHLAGQVGDTGGVYFVPAFVGLGAPHWSSAARGTLTGITGGTTAAHVARATLEAIAYQVRDVFDVMASESGSKLQVLLADGGASRNDQLIQFQADILGVPVVRSLSPELSALGAAYLAGLTLGIWSSEAEVAGLPRPTDRFEPRLAQDERAARYAGWQAAVGRTTYMPGNV